MPNIWQLDEAAALRQVVNFLVLNMYISQLLLKFGFGIFFKISYREKRIDNNT